MKKVSQDLQIYAIKKCIIATYLIYQLTFDYITNYKFYYSIK